MKLYLNRYIINIIFLIYNFILMSILIVPGNPYMPSAGLDPSWQWGIDHAIHYDLQFGKDIIFTYGPFGSYRFPDTMFTLFSYKYHLVVSLIFSFTVAISLSILLENKKIINKFFIPFGLFIALSIGHWIFFFFVQILFLMLVINMKESKDKILIYFLIILVAFSALIKFSHFPTALLLFIGADIYLYYKNKVFYYITPVFLLSIVLFFIASGQNLFNLFDYFIQSIQITSGYSEAMQISGSLSILLVFLFLSGWFFICLVRNYLLKKDLTKLFISILFLLIWFIGFKSGFVRFDGHAVQAYGILLILVIFFYVLVKDTMNLSLLLITLFSSIIISAHYSNLQTLNFLEVKSNEYREKFKSMPNIFSSEKMLQLNKSYDSALQHIRSQDPLPPLRGTVDIYPWDIATILAHGLEYQPRPIFQSYSVYTEALIEKNKYFLQSQKASEHILFNVLDIDNRLPSMMEGANWLEILNRYDVVDIFKNYVLLSKRNLPKESFLLEDGHSFNVAFDEVIKLPEDMTLIWSSIHIEKSSFGKVLKTFYKSPILYIEITYANGDIGRNRIVPQVANAGFILSPKIENKEDFVIFALEPEVLLSNKKVVSIRLTGEGFYKQAYKNNIKVDFQDIKFQTHRSEIDMSEKAKTIFLKSKYISKSNAKYELYKGEEILFSHIPTSIIIDMKDLGIKKQMNFKYAIKEEAYTKGNTKGACFIIMAVDDKSSAEIFRRCIDPKNITEDQGLQQSSVIINENIKKIKLITSTSVSNDPSWGWTYWKNVTFTKDVDESY
jgi:hypothetical protein